MADGGWHTNDHQRYFARPEKLPKPASGGSWWLDKDRAAFNEQLEAEAPRMAASTRDSNLFVDGRHR